MVYFKRSNFSIPLAVATMDLIVSRIGPKYSTNNSNSAIGPIRDTIKSTVAANGIEDMENPLKEPYSCSEEGSMNPK